jgi:hypothetical protein
MSSKISIENSIDLFAANGGAENLVHDIQKNVTHDNFKLFLTAQLLCVKL